MRCLIHSLLILMSLIIGPSLWTLAQAQTLAPLEGLTIAHDSTQDSKACTPRVDGIYVTRTDAESPASFNTHLKAEWQAVTLPDIWTKRWPTYTGVTWYRIDWHTECSKPPTEPLALLISGINMAGSVWINEHLLWADSHLTEPLSRSWNVPRYLTLPSATLKTDAINQLYVRVVGDFITSPGLGNITFGSLHEINALYKQTEWNQRTIYYLNIIFSITLGMVCTCIWLFRRQEVAYGWYTLTSIFWVAFIANTLITETAPFSNTLSFTKLNVVLFLGYTFCFAIFSWRFLNKRFLRVEKLFFGLCLVLSVAIWLAPFDLVHSTLLFVFYASIIIFSINSIFVSHLCFQTRQVELWLLAITLITCLILSTISILSLFHMLGNISLVLPYTSLVFAIFLSIILAMRLTQSLQKIEDFNDELHQKILAAEQALEATLNNRHQLSIKNNQLKERLNLAHDLHDGLGSSIVRSILEVSNAKEPLNNKQTLSILSLLRNDLRQIIDSFSESQTKLPSNPIYWLAPLRNRFIQVFDDIEIKLHWEVDSKWGVSTPSAIQCLTLYRVAEEALTNVIKHSQASEVTFRCIVKEDEIELNIIDNGVGFQVNDIMRSGISVGMSSMQRRLERLSGWLEIYSKPGETRIIVHSPYESPAAQKE